MSFQILWRDKLIHGAGTLNFGENFGEKFWNDIVVPYGFFFSFIYCILKMILII